MPIFVRLPDDIEKRLAALALETGRSKDFFIREAVTEYIDDLEDIYLSEKIIERVRRGEERTFDITTQEEVRQALESLSYRFASPFLYFDLCLILCLNLCLSARDRNRQAENF